MSSKTMISLDITYDYNSAQQYPIKLPKPRRVGNKMQVMLVKSARYNYSYGILAQWATGEQLAINIAKRPITLATGQLPTGSEILNCYMSRDFTNNNDGVVVKGSVPFDKGQDYYEPIIQKEIYCNVWSNINSSKQFSLIVELQEIKIDENQYLLLLKELETMQDRDG
jgi:hypothetical protein